MAEHHVPSKSLWSKDLKTRKAELITDIKASQQDSGTYHHLLNSILDEKLEYESHYTHRDLPLVAAPQTPGIQQFTQVTEPSHNSLQLGEPPEAVSDVHFYKDLNPYLRRFNAKRPKDDQWTRRKV